MACVQAVAAITAQSTAAATAQIVLVGMVVFPISCSRQEFDGGLPQTSRHPAGKIPAGYD
jgi:hypothetical protein